MRHGKVNEMNVTELFEMLVKDHVAAGADIHTAFGRAMQEDPEAYGQYLKRQKDSTSGGHERDGGNVQ